MSIITIDTKHIAVCNWVRDQNDLFMARPEFNPRQPPRDGELRWRDFVKTKARELNAVASCDDLFWIQISLEFEEYDINLTKFLLTYGY